MASKSILSLLPASAAVNKSVTLLYREHSSVSAIDTWPSLAYFLLIGGAISAIFLLGVILQLTGIQIIVLCAVAGGLVGGLLFTVLRLVRPHDGGHRT